MSIGDVNSNSYRTVDADSGGTIRVVVSYIDASSNQRVVSETLFFNDSYATIGFQIATSDGDDVIHSVAGINSNTTNAKGGNDVVYGGAHAETIIGGAGHDTLHGGNGGDTLNGDAGNDVLYGGGGDDTLNGGAGNDILNAGGGSGNRFIAALVLTIMS